MTSYHFWMNYFYCSSYLSVSFFTVVRVIEWFLLQTSWMCSYMYMQTRHSSPVIRFVTFSSLLKDASTNTIAVRLCFIFCAFIPLYVAIKASFLTVPTFFTGTNVWFHVVTIVGYTSCDPSVLYSNDVRGACEARCILRTPFAKKISLNPK